MRIKAGPRPWSIHLFAAGLLAVALIGPSLALADPMLEWFKWSKRLPLISWSQDGAIIAAFSVFTMALFPLVWIYGYGSLRARWIVLAFAIVKVGLWWHGMMVTALAGWSQSLRWLEPVLTTLAVSMMFAPTSLRWLEKDREVGCDEAA
ncbi:MAG: hypothetical protein AAF291_10565 [Pseudomonadota bacterium]